LYGIIKNSHCGLNDTDADVVAVQTRMRSLTCHIFSLVLV